MPRKKEILENYQLYISRTGRDGVTLEELAPLVINLNYLQVLKSRQKGIIVNEEKLFYEYLSSASEIFPALQSNYVDPMGYFATLQWDGLWDFLANYFQNNLGVSIDNTEREVVRFDSLRHIRYENDLFISESEVERKISITFTNSKKTCQVAISPSLSPKQANLDSVIGNTFRYIGTDPDYLFVIDYDQFDNIEKFSLTLTNRNVRIDYFE